MDSKVLLDHLWAVDKVRLAGRIGATTLVVIEAALKLVLSLP